MNDDRFDTYFKLVTDFALYPSKVGLKHRLDYMFKDVDFQGKTMLDIGAGSGLFSLYGACMGAKSVTSLEPELAGGMKGTAKILTQMSERLPEYHISPLMVSFQDFNSGDQTFDIILLAASINHLDEEACVNLKNSEDARSKYRSIFQKLGEMASPKAKLIISDCSRYNFFPLLGLPNPLVPTIEWQKHQSPRLWADMLSEYNFSNPKIKWESPSTRLAPGRWFFRNQVGAYLTTSSFCLVMDKRNSSI